MIPLSLEDLMRLHISEDKEIHYRIKKMWYICIMEYYTAMMKTTSMCNNMNESHITFSNKKISYYTISLS